MNIKERIARIIPVSAISKQQWPIRRNDCVIYVMSTKTAYKVDADTAPITLKKGQSLVGSCIDLTVQDKKVPALTPGKLPKILVQ